MNNGMKTYRVTISEKLQMNVEVEAKNRYEAERLVSNHWRNGDYILDADSFVDVSFRAAEPERGYER